MKSDFPKWARGPVKHILDVSLDLWSDPGDVRLTKINAGQQERVKDMERIGGDIRKAASEVFRKADHGRNRRRKPRA